MLGQKRPQSYINRHNTATGHSPHTQETQLYVRTTYEHIIQI